MHTSRQQYFEQLMDDFQRLAKTMSRDKHAHLSDLPFGQRAALFTISMHERLPIKKLAAELQITSGAATQHVDALVKAGLVERTEDQDDRRLVHVTLSKAGHKRLKIIKKAKVATFETMFRDVPDKDLIEFVTTVQNITKHITGGEK
jgi:DNA-binding MarR family transcriptional regulator